MKVSIQEAFDQISEALKEIWKNIEQIETEIEQLKSPRVELKKPNQNKDESVRLKGCHCPKCDKAILLKKAIDKIWAFDCDHCGVSGNLKFGPAPTNTKE